MLVIYDEVVEAAGPMHRRAYWLSKNTDRIEKGRKPRFTSVSDAVNLTPIPVVETTSGTLPPETGELYAIVSTNGCNFTLYTKGGPDSGGKDQELGFFKLPIYPTKESRVTEALLTPVAIIVAVVIVAGVLIVVGYAETHTGS